MMPKVSEGDPPLLPELLLLSAPDAPLTRLPYAVTASCCGSQDAFLHQPVIGTTAVEKASMHNHGTQVQTLWANADCVAVKFSHIIMSTRLTVI